MAVSGNKTKKSKKKQEEYPLDPLGKPSDGIGEALQSAYLKSTMNEGKKKRNNKQLLESLKKGEALQKDEDDATLLANTFDPDADPKNTKSNKQRQKQSLDADNHAFSDCENEEKKPAKEKTKKKKKRDAELIEQMPEAVEFQNANKLEEEMLSVSRKTKKKKKSGNRAMLTDSETANPFSDGEVAKMEVVNETKRNNESPQRPKRKKKTKKKGGDSDGALSNDPEAAAADAAAEEDSREVMQVIVHRADKLKSDFYISHPLVRVHVIDIDSGDYLKKRHKDRPVSSRFETEHDKVDYILPIMTLPFDYKKNHSTLPVWEDNIIFNESFSYFVRPERKVLLIFELVDFVRMNTANKNYNDESQRGGWHQIGWAFLRLIGANGQPNIGKKVRLQLYLMPTSHFDKEGHAEVFSWWSSNQRIPYPSTLYVTVKPIVISKGIEPSTRSMFAIQEERGLIGYDDIQRTIDGKKGLDLLDGQQFRQTSPWLRLAGQQCKIPNSLMCSLSAGRKGCFVVKFSHDGKKLACGCHERDTYPVLLYEVPSGRLRGELTGHCSIIYDLCWSRDDKELLSASGDGTTRLWDIGQSSESLKKMLPHPSFVYSAKFHPHVSKIVVTGGYDRLIRIWSMQTDEVQALLLQELEGHLSFVNTLCFDEEGIQMFSGDSLGNIFVWNVFVTEKPSSKGLLKEWTKKKEMSDPDIKGNAINQITLHPNGRRLLVHSRNNKLYLIDLRIESVMHKYIGALNFRERIRSSMTPCGTFIFSGSEDGQVYVWNTDSGDQVVVYSDLGYRSSVCDVDFHPLDNIVAFCSHGDSQPVKLYRYDPKAAQKHIISELAEPFQPCRTADRISPGTQLTQKQDTQRLDSLRTTGMGDFTIAQSARYELVMQKLQAIGQQTERMTASPSFVPDSSLQYMPTLSGASDWRPGFTPISGRTGSLRSSGMNAPCKPQFTFGAEGKSKILFTGSTGQRPEVVVVLYDYLAQRSDELTLVRGDKIKVLYKDNENWWMGELDDGQQGFFPTNYVVSASASKVEKETEQPQPEDNRRVSDLPCPIGSDMENSSYRKTTHAVVDERGALRYISATEESDTESVTKRPRKKKTRKSTVRMTAEAQIERPPRASKTSARKKAASPAPT